MTAHFVHPRLFHMKRAPGWPPALRSVPLVLEALHVSELGGVAGSSVDLGGSGDTDRQASLWGHLPAEPGERRVTAWERAFWAWWFCCRLHLTGRGHVQPGVRRTRLSRSSW